MEEGEKSIITTLMGRSKQMRTIERLNVVWAQQHQKLNTITMMLDG